MARDFRKLLFPRDFKTTFGKYDRIVDRTLEEIPDMLPPTRPKATPRRPYVRKGSRASPRYPRTSMKKRKRTYTRKTTFRKARKVSKTPMKNVVRRKYDDNSVVTKDRCLWLGVHHHASYTRLYDIIGEACLKALMDKAKIYVRHYDEPTSDTIGSVTLYFKRINTATGADEYDTSADNTISATPGVSFKDFATAVADRIQLRASAGSPGGGGYYLYSMSLKRTGSSSIYDHQITEMDCAKLEIQVQREITLQNITRSEDATGGETGTSVDIDSNPLVGKKYKFYEPIPKVFDEIRASNVGTDFFGNYTPNAAGLQTTVDQPEDSLLSHPVNGKNIFCNVKKEGGVYLAPGKYKKEKVTFSFKGSLKDWVLKNPINAQGLLYNYTVTPSGSCTLFAFEQQLRHGTRADVKIGVNVSTNMQAKVTPVMPKRIMKHYQESVLTL